MVYVSSIYLKPDICHRRWRSAWYIVPPMNYLPIGFLLPISSTKYDSPLAHDTSHLLIFCYTLYSFGSWIPRVRDYQTKARRPILISLFPWSHRSTTLNFALFLVGGISYELWPVYRRPRRTPRNQYVFLIVYLYPDGEIRRCTDTMSMVELYY